jgi:hypothetical protein
LNIKVDFLFVICKCRLLSVESYKCFFTTNCSMHVYTVIMHSRGILIHIGITLTYFSPALIIYLFPIIIELILSSIFA